jgi:hypothetical protein
MSRIEEEKLFESELYEICDGRASESIGSKYCWLVGFSCNIEKNERPAILDLLWSQILHPILVKTVRMCSYLSELFFKQSAHTRMYSEEKKLPRGFFV